MEELLLDPLTAQSLTAFLPRLLQSSQALLWLASQGSLMRPLSASAMLKYQQLVASLFSCLTLVGALWGDVNATLITVNGNDALWVFLGCGA